MKNDSILLEQGRSSIKRYIVSGLLLVSCICLIIYFFFQWRSLANAISADIADNNPVAANANKNNDPAPKQETKVSASALALYKEKMNHIINNDSSGRWVIKPDAPLPGAILPYKRIIAFYGNLYSKGMGILGELPSQEMLQKLQQEVKVWQQADSLMEVQPALHYIAVTAQGLPGKGGKYRLRMPFHQIDSVLN
ncbi:MAG: hypothetical protein M3O67_03155, partial [Bacteroidota bacterium]|nr:hypothetical protein [Bacteroidota bacterium]